MIEGKYLVIEGNIGAGKTSLVNRIVNQFGGTAVFEEFAENTFLPLFYEDPSKYAFPLELSFLAARYKQLQELITEESKTAYVADYYFQKSFLFASVNLTIAEQELYRSFFNILNQKLRKPDLVIYLNNPIEKLLKNIKMRGRDFETHITAEYLSKIDAGYKNIFTENRFQKHLIIDTHNLDFVNNDADFKHIADLIRAEF